MGGGSPSEQDWTCPNVVTWNPPPCEQTERQTNTTENIITSAVITWWFWPIEVKFTKELCVTLTFLPVKYSEIIKWSKLWKLDQSEVCSIFKYHLGNWICQCEIVSGVNLYCVQPHIYNPISWPNFHIFYIIAKRIYGSYVEFILN